MSDPQQPPTEGQESAPGPPPAYPPQPAQPGYPPPPQPGYAQPGYPQQGYPQQGYPAQPGYPPPGFPTPPGGAAYGQAPAKSHTLRNVLLIVGLLLILFVGGCVALVVAAGNSINNEIDKITAGNDEPGGINNPLVIEPGKAFSAQGFEYASGWSVAPGELGVDVQGLKATNTRNDSESVVVEIKFYEGSEILATADCSSGGQVPEDAAVTLDCFSSDQLPADYDRITYSNSFPF